MKQLLNRKRCDGTASNCEHLASLVESMKQYQNNVNIIENHDYICSCLHDFLHFLFKHNSNNSQAFEIIYNEFNEAKCDSNNCKLLKKKTDKTNVNQQIMDKIHCYFIHSYAMGYRLTSEDLLLLKNIENDDVNNYGLINQTVTKTKHFIASKRKSWNSVGRFDRLSRYNTLISQQIEILITEFDSFNINKCETKQTEELYNFGYPYEYADCDDNCGDNFGDNFVFKTYSNLKEELIQNIIATVTIEQYHNEKQKAKMHLTSQNINEYAKVHCIYFELDKSCLNHILAVLMYCNYDDLQREFSKTYRKTQSDQTKYDVIKKHSNFYWLGKYLKEAVCVYGSEISNETCFYHGINKKMLFPAVFEYVINCPVSTSKSFPVAVNFATPNGIVVEFSNQNRWPKDARHVGGGYYRGTGDGGSGNFYFSCEWLSDYAAERECLFIQDSAELCIENVIELSTGIEYKMILNACDIIDNDILQFHCDETIRANQTDMTLAIALIEHQIALKCPYIGFKKLDTLSHYAQNWISHWFTNSKSIRLDWSKNYKWMFIDCLNILKPNTDDICYVNFDVSQTTYMMDNIYKYLSKK
eukprot:500554_1